ncbi:MAG: hypothetical protein Q4F99_04075 [bacterium]|nr:hypothetical protein [bacterium]
MKTILLSLFLLGAFAVTTEVHAEASSQLTVEMEAHVKEMEARLATALAKIEDPLARARTELQMREFLSVDFDQYRKQMMSSGKLTTPEIEELKAKRKALLDEAYEIEKQIFDASAKAPEVQAFDQHREANEDRIRNLREDLTLMTPAERRALEAKKSSKNSKN